MSGGQRQLVYVWRTEAGGVCLEDRGRWFMSRDRWFMSRDRWFMSRGQRQVVYV